MTGVQLFSGRKWLPALLAAAMMQITTTSGRGDTQPAAACELLKIGVEQYCIPRSALEYFRRDVVTHDVVSLTLMLPYLTAPTPGDTRHFYGHVRSYQTVFIGISVDPEEIRAMSWERIQENLRSRNSQLYSGQRSGPFGLTELLLNLDAGVKPTGVAYVARRHDRSFKINCSDSPGIPHAHDRSPQCNFVVPYHGLAVKIFFPIHVLPEWDNLYETVGLLMSRWRKD